MIQKEFNTYRNNVTLFGKVYEPNNIDNVDKVIIICHGMAEHIDRYDNFMEFLCNNNYIVVGYDQRGHGKTAGSLELCGYMDDVDNFECLVLDLFEVVKNVKKEYLKKDIIIFGHSMGSFVLQRFMQLYGNYIQGAMLSGSSYNKGLYYSFARTLTSIITKIKGRRYQSQFVHNQSFSSFNKKFKPSITTVDWLSRDIDNDKKYEEDEYCGKVFSVSYYKDLTNGFKTITKEFELVPNSLPIYIMSGDKDPVGRFSKGTKKLYNKYLKVGINDIEIKLYPDGRHEMLNEINKEEVYNDILAWLNKHTNKLLTENN